METKVKDIKEKEVTSKILFEMETDPCITDIVSYDYVADMYPDMVIDYMGEHGIRSGKDLSDEDKEQIIMDNFSEDQDQYDWHWEDCKESLARILEEVGFEIGDTVRVYTERCTWQPYSSGYSEFEYKDIKSFVRKTFGAFGDEFTARIYEMNKGSKILSASIFTHDIPCETILYMEVLENDESE